MDSVAKHDHYGREQMLRTLALCSGKGGVGKTLLATSLARIIQREEDCNVVLVDLDLSVRGLTLLAFQNKYALDQVPVALTDYLSGGPDKEQELFEELYKSVPGNGHVETPRSLYRRLEKVFILPASTESERQDWGQFTHMELDQAVEKLGRLQTFVLESLNVEYLIFDTQAGLGSLSLAATTLSDMNLVVLEEDDISWRTALTVFLEITALNKQLRKRARNYFLANKVTPGLLDTADKLKAFSFLPPVPYDSWMHKLFAHSTSAVLEREFENSDFFRYVHDHVWQEIAITLGLTEHAGRSSSLFRSWWRR